MKIQLIFSALLLSAASAVNASLINDQVTIAWNFPDAGTVAFGQTADTIVAADDSDVITLFGTLQVDMNGSGFVMTDTSGFIGGAGNFNGLHVSDMQWLDQPGSISGLVIQATNLDANSIVGTIGPNGDEVFIDVRGVAGNNLPAWEIVVNFETIHAPVPLPATLALFGVGLAGLGWSSRKPMS